MAEIVKLAKTGKRKHVKEISIKVCAYFQGPCKMGVFGNPEKINLFSLVYLRRLKKQSALRQF